MMIDTLQRRNRTKRNPSGKHIRLNERDMRIFSLLYRYGMLDSADLAAFILPVSRKRFIERLGTLYHDGGYIDRPQLQWRLFGALYRPITYSLSKRGAVALGSQYDFGVRAIVTRSAGNKNIAQCSVRPQFEHSTLISKAIAQVELSILNTQTSETANRRFIPVAQIMERVKSQSGGQTSKERSIHDLSFPVTIPPSRDNLSLFRTSVIPDGLYGIEYKIENKRLYRFFALEVELTSPLRRRNLSKSSFFKKLLAYKAAIYSKSYQPGLGIPNLFIHFVASDEEKLSKMKALATDILSPEELKLFRFSHCSM